VQALLDTHVFAWVLLDDPALSEGGRRAIAAADATLVSPVSLYEIGQKVRLGRWPEIAPIAAELPELLSQAGLLAAPLTPGVALRASLMDWDHRDPFDRLIAATAEITGAQLVSRDAAFDVLPIRRVW
jgi:PIN domain nuclease of toxin-antitoxin system